MLFLVILHDLLNLGHVQIIEQAVGAQHHHIILLDLVVIFDCQMRGVPVLLVPELVGEVE